MRTEAIVSSSGSGLTKDPKKKEFLSKLTTRLMSFILMMVVCLNMVTPAHAYSSVHIQCSIDLATWEILTSVVKDDIGLSASSPEWRRMTEDDLNALAAAGGQFALSTSLIDEANVAAREKPVAHGGNILSGLNGVIQNFGVNTEKNRVLTFPTDQDNRNSSNAVDMESALNANNAIVFDLNQAFNVYCERNSITKTQDATAMLTAIKGFMSSLSPSGDYVSYYASTEGSDMVNYRWRVEKYKGGSEYITWNMLIVEAFNNFSLQGEEAIDSENVYGSSMPNQLSKVLTGMLSELLNGLRGILGMWSMDELLFNQGWRSAGYIGGIFPRSWEATIWALFIFMEIIGAMILLFGVLNNVLKQATSTINTIARIHAMSQIQDILVCAVALTLLPIALRMVIALSGNLVDIVSAMRPISTATGEPKEITEMVQRFSSSSGSIGGVIAQFLFFGVQVYFNFFYAIRALSVAVLIIIAPMMIAMITVSSARKQTTVNWMKELMANILIQPIHTFIITVILILPTSTHGFDNLVALYAMIPLTSMIRGLFFGPAGGWIDQASNRGKLAVTGAIGGAAIGAASAGVSGIAGAIKGHSGGGGSDGKSGGNGGEGGNTTPDNNLANSRSGGTTNNSASGENGGTGNGSNGGTGAGGTNGGAGGASGEGAAGGESGNTAPAMNDAAGSNTQTPSPANTPNSASGGTKQKVPFTQTKAGRVLTPLAKIGGGALLGAVGGAISGAGYGQIGSQIEHAGVSLASSKGTQRGKNDEESDNNNTQKQPQNSNQSNKATPDSSDTSLSRPKSSPDTPVDLSSAGKRKANEFNGDKEMQVREMKQADLDKMGISNVDDSKKALEFTAKGDSPQAQELGAYADYLQSLPVDERKKEVDERGCMATRTDDGVQVRIDKDKWSKANDGAQIRAFTNDKGDTTMRIKSPEGAKTPSLQGSAPKYAPVTAAAIPAATVSFGARMKSGEAVQESPEARKRMEAAGMSEGNIKRASERAGRISQLRAQGYSPTEAARMSKRDMAGLDRSCEVSIPTAELTPEQQNTMIQAQQKNLVANTGDAYTATYKADGEAFAAAFNDENADYGVKAQTFGTEAQDDTSFTARAGQMSEIQAVQPPAVTGEVSTPPPTETHAPEPPAAVGAPSTPTPASVSTSASVSSEQNGVSTVSVPLQPTTGINPALAQRYESYKVAKQTTSSAAEAYKESHRNIGASAPTAQPVRSRPQQTSYDSGSFGVNRTRPAPVSQPQSQPRIVPASQAQSSPASAPAQTPASSQVPTYAAPPIPEASSVPMQNISSYTQAPPVDIPDHIDPPVPPSTSHLTDRGVVRSEPEPTAIGDPFAPDDEQGFPFTVAECSDMDGY